ncbi:MAG: MFS transporter [Chloroflexi bacterium]|nr:MFS transporter [Chloroflexota bacterium]
MSTEGTERATEEAVPARTVEPTAQERRGHLQLRTFSSLEHRDFRYFWASTFFASAAQWIQQITIGWLVYQMTGSAFLLGAINGVRALPFLFVSPIAGVLADRFERRGLLVGTQVALGVLAILFAVGVQTGRIEVWHIFLFSLLTGVAWTFNQPARMAILPNLVPRAQLMNSMSLTSASFNVTRIIGPAVGGLLIAFVGAAGNFYLQAGLYVLVILMVLPIRIPPVGQEARSRSMMENLAEGARYVTRERLILTLVLLGLMPSILIMPYMSLMPAFAKDTLGQGPEGLGFLMAAAGVGALVGMLTLASLGDVRRKGLLILWCGVLMSLGLIFFSRSTILPVAIVSLMLLGAFSMSFMSTNNVIIQTIIPDNLRGRIMSIYNLDWGLMPLGSLIAGLIAEEWGTPNALTIFGLLSLIIAVVALLRIGSLRRA